MRDYSEEKKPQKQREVGGEKGLMVNKRDSSSSSSTKEKAKGER